MKPETWVAVYAAVVGTSAFFLNLKVRVGRETQIASRARGHDMSPIEERLQR
jgi:hypothetical protein